ncbi:MAG: hypothetical protein PHO37_10145 [Kiritimatiellae bacterium]|nr:hypothetical protein [Kiritimatiellia bacterium]
MRRLFYGLCLLVVLSSSCIALAEDTPKHHSAEDVDQAVERGLAWIAAGQHASGFFGNQKNATQSGVWALCGMAFLAKGYVPGTEPYGHVVEKIVKKIAEEQRPDGYLSDDHGKMYSHCIATLFLSEVSGMVRPELQKIIDQTLPKALQLIIDAQNIPKDQNNRGGWRYKPDSSDSDFSCSGWALMALRSARLNGAQIPPESIKSAVEYILRRHDESEGCFGYTDTRSHAVTLTGAGILCLSLCGEHANPAIGRASRYLMKNYEKLPNDNYCFYGMYYAAQGLFQMGGEEWKTFSQWMYDTWIPKQFEDGHWDRQEQNTFYQTAMVVLAFTVPYRQLPIYQRDETVDE